jgi:intracellular multiplication protein IcmD
MKRKTFLYLLIASAFFAIGTCFAQGSATPGTIGEIASNVTESFQGIGTLMIAISYLAGIGFVLASIFKFKQHKDNPTQIPLGTPLALLVLGIILIFLPMIFAPAGKTIFGEGATTGGFKGAGVSTIPGATNP